MTKKKKTIVWIIVAVLFIVIVVPVSGYGILSLINPNPPKKRVAHIENDTGYVQAYGRNIYDENGYILFFNGVNLGNWFDQEYWMAVSSVGDRWGSYSRGQTFQTGRYTQKRGLAAMRANPNLTEEDIEELNRLYIDTYIREEDFKNIADLALNCVRINFTCYNLTSDGYRIREDAFDKIDWALNMCEKYGLYAILDYHGAIGSQNKDIHSGNDETFDLYGNEKNEEATKEIWRTIARRYKGRNVIAAFDLLNEPRRAEGKFTGRINFDFYDELYKVMECFTFPTHGVNEKRYGWENICISYHYYNHTPFSEKFSINFYRVTHNLMGYDVPIIIGEFSEWGDERNWHEAFDAFDKMGWSYLSWTYKTNRYLYKNNDYFGEMNTWGLYELDIRPVNLFTATKEEIANTYAGTGTENAEKSLIYGVYEKRLGIK